MTDDPIAAAANVHHENVREAIESLSLSSVLAVVARRYRDRGQECTSDVLCDAIIKLPSF